MGGYTWLLNGGLWIYEKDERPYSVVEMDQRWLSLKGEIERITDERMTLIEGDTLTFKCNYHDNSVDAMGEESTCLAKALAIAIESGYTVGEDESITLVSPNYPCDMIIYRASNEKVYESCPNFNTLSIENQEIFSF